jgi:hypothetical protein
MKQKLQLVGKVFYDEASTRHEYTIQLKDVTKKDLLESLKAYTAEKDTKYMCKFQLSANGKLYKYEGSCHTFVEYIDVLIKFLFI